MLAVLILDRMSKLRASRRQGPPNVCTTELISLDMYCRTCLTTENLVPIFYNEKVEETRKEELKLATGLEIKMDDGLSQRICTQCIEIMDMAVQFRRTSRKAEKNLLKLMSGDSKKKFLTPLHKISKPNVKRPKVEKVELNDYSYEIYSEELQNDEDDYMDRGTDKSKRQPGKKNTDTVPNCAPYNCSTCNKEFRMKATYKAHMRFHNNYCVCETCGKRCRNNNQLQEHKRARHGLHKIHKCNYCDYSSATKEALTIHERRHTGERPYVCDHCGATFHRRSNLVQHIAIHLPEKNFQCDMCPKRLKSRKFLQIHKHNAHTGKRYGYLCGICDHRFEKPNKVRAHLRRVHGLPDEQHGPIVRVQL